MGERSREFNIRPVVADLASEIATLHEMNQQSVPSVGDIPLERMAKFARIASVFSVAEAIGASGPVAFLIALGPDADYVSPNFIWFRERREHFLYVDRLAVAASHRRCGLGRGLYEHLLVDAHETGCPSITCEVLSNRATRYLSSSMPPSASARSVVLARRDTWSRISNWK